MAWYVWLLLIGAVLAIAYYVIKRMYGTELNILKFLSHPFGVL